MRTNEFSGSWPFKLTCARSERASGCSDRDGFDLYGILRRTTWSTETHEMVEKTIPQGEDVPGTDEEQHTAPPASIRA